MVEVADHGNELVPGLHHLLKSKEGPPELGPGATAP